MSRQWGFTLVELIVMMVIMGVLAAYVGAKLNLASHDAAGHAETIKASIRLAQKLAIARRANVTVTLTPDVAVGGDTYAKPNGVSVSGAPPSITFDGLGRPSITAVASITVSGGDVSRLICVEPVTGYVHEETSSCS
ncbi:MAG: prepilin-type N-terminal cleavage/methylation domain-containing protein [Methylophilaceae bacterium]|nr:prepilin-type N-terminal cleavage/methylation domain-containing protein [Methylophilaceae bacterium]